MAVRQSGIPANRKSIKQDGSSFYHTDGLMTNILEKTI